MIITLLSGLGTIYCATLAGCARSDGNRNSMLRWLAAAALFFIIQVAHLYKI